MRYKRRLVCCLLLVVSITQIVLPQNRPPFFKDADMMSIGVYYYPEAWPEQQWARDVANIKSKLGLEFIHMGEFAWAFMEPKEGKFDLDWLERVVDLAAKQNLKVILCTPSATPPVWLTRAHPEVLMIDASGRRMEHGSREQACWSVPLYRQYVAKINTELVKRFGNNPNVIGWQIDNELSHYGKDYCYCDFCQAKFRAWLKTKYGTVAKLNQDWGNSFWSQMYQNFEQIRIPNQEELVQQVNPHALLDFQRWFAEEAADYIRFQAGTLRQHSHNQWITTNFMSMHKAVYPALSGKDLDITTWTLYPVHGNLNDGDLGFRLGDGAQMSFMHDFTRAINGNEGLMELQPGQVNWGKVNPQPLPGAIHMWIMRAFAAGAKLVCTYRYRQPLAGGEMYHNGLAQTDGVTPSYGGKEYARAMRDVRLMRGLRQPNAIEPREYAARRTAFLYNFDNRWDIDNHTQTSRWNTIDHLMKYYKALKSFGAPVDVITEDKDFSKYPFLVAPAYQLVDENLVGRWTKYVQDGGHLVLSCRTATKDRRGHLWEASLAAPISSLIGAQLTGYDLLPPPYKAQAQAGNKSYEWGTWGDFLKPNQGTSVLAVYADQFYKGNAAAVTRSLGKGSVTYIGVESMSGELEKDLLRGMFEQSRVAVRNFDNQFIVDWRDGFWIATNFTDKKQTASIPANAKIIAGSKDVEPAGVTIWKE